MNSELIVDIEKISEMFMVYNVGDKVIYVVGILMFLALLVVLLSKKFRVPIVVGYVFLGIVLSVNIIEWMPFLTESQKEWYIFTVDSFDYIADIALAFIAFTIGSELSIKTLKKMGKSILYIVPTQAIAPFILVTLAIVAIGQPLYIGLLLGGIASATAPAATVMVIREYNAKGPLTSMIMAIVGIDDALALIIFSLIEPIALIQFSGQGVISIQSVLITPLIEIIGSLVIGIIIGYFSQMLIVSVEDKTKKIMTLVATIIGATALSVSFHFSPLITNMAVGFAYRNFARKNPGIAVYMETLTTPLYAMFFILAGTEIRFDQIASASFLLIAFVYLIARIIGKAGGAFLGAWLADAPDKIKKYVGLGLFPQSGVAIALAYTVQKDFASAPEIGLLIFNTLLFTAVLTEVIGPLATKYALIKSGEGRDT